MQMLLTAIVLVAAVVLLMALPRRIELTALGIVVALPALGLLSPAQALSGFASEATVTVAAMFVLSAGLRRTGALDGIAALLARIAAGRPALLLPAVAVTAALPSAFLNNTAIVVVLVPVILALCRDTRLAPSKLMLPLSYFAILGGTLTVIGTSTNILVDSLYRQAGGPGFRMFEFTPMGLAYLAVGGAYLLVAAPRLLPERTVLSQLLDARQRSNFVTEIVVPASFAGTRLGALAGDEVKVLELVRGEEVELGPAAATPLAAGDALLVEGSPRALHRLLDHPGLDLASAVADDERIRISRLDLTIVEAVVTPASALAGQTLGEAGLARRFGVRVLAIQRLGRHHRARLRTMPLAAGDVLLVQAEAEALAELEASGGVLLVEGVEKTLSLPERAPRALAIMAAVVGLATVGWLPISILALAGAAAMVLTGCLRWRQAAASLETGVLLLLVGTLPLGLAMAESGLADLLARKALLLAAALGPVALIAVLYLTTSLMTEVLSNNAAAVLLTPIVLGIAAESGIDPKPLLVAVTFGASASFATPIGYQTNTLVMGPGGYRFSDYLRLGLPLDLILLAAATLLIPLFWPLTPTGG